MRFMMLVKHAEKNSGPPPKELMDALAKLSEEAVKAGTIVASGGLAPTAMSTRVRLSRGKISTIDGPFTEAKEIVRGGRAARGQSKRRSGRRAVAGIRDPRQPGRLADGHGKASCDRPAAPRQPGRAQAPRDRPRARCPAGDGRGGARGGDR